MCMSTVHPADTVQSWSLEQQDIFEWFRTSKVVLNAHSVDPTCEIVEHLVVRARAGTGKTTTIVKGVGFAPEQRILVGAFNKRNAEELTARLSQVNPRAVAKTFHSIGFGCVQRFWSGVRVDEKRSDRLSRADWLTEKVCGGIAPDAIKKLVSRLHTISREIAPHASQPGDLKQIAVTFECEPDDAWETTRFNLDYVEAKALEAMELAASTKPVETGIDFADMIFLPVRNGWMMKSWDLVVIDEAQDMTVAQLELARGVCRGRVCVVGDDRQAIYAFRGADADSLDRLKAELGAAELGLTTTYRCGHAIVRLATEIVPDFRAGASNPEGIISSILDDSTYTNLRKSITVGDFLLSRVNAPLVAVAMSLLRSGVRARIAGRDIGTGLKVIIRRLAKGSAAHSIPQLIARINAWETKDVARYTAAKREDKVALVRDQADTLITLTDGAKNVHDVEARIDALFTDDGLGQAGVVTCSSVHRAKGLEANRVFILGDTLRNHTTEEMNIQYVAITRAKRELVFVSTK